MTKGRVFLRGKIWWIAYSYKGEERRETSHSEDKREAEALLAQRIAELGLDRIGVKPFRGPEMGKVLVTDLIDNLLSHYALRRQKSLVAIRDHLKPVQESFRKERVRDVDPARLRRYVAQREAQGRAPSTIQVELAFLKRAFNLGMEEELIAYIPRFPSIQVRNARQGFFEAGDFAAVVDELPYYLKDLARFAYLTSWRKNEIINLRWEDVDLDGRVIRLRGDLAKNDQGRVVALEGELGEIINRRALDRTKADTVTGTLEFIPWVFHNQGNKIKSIKTAWEGATRRAGLKGMLFHDLRRTGIRNMIRAGVSQNVAMKISGHKTDSIFRRYDIIDERDLRDAALKLQSHLSQVPKERNIVQLRGG